METFEIKKDKRNLFFADSYVVECKGVKAKAQKKEHLVELLKEALYQQHKTSFHVKLIDDSAISVATA